MKKERSFLILLVSILLVNILVACNSGGGNTSAQEPNVTQNFMHQLTYIPLSGDPKLRLSRGFRKSPFGTRDGASGQVDLYFSMNTYIESQSVSFYSSSDCSGSPVYSNSIGSAQLLPAGHYLIAESNAYSLCSLFGGNGVGNANCLLEQSMTRSISFNFGFINPPSFHGQVSPCLTSLNNPAIPGNYGELIANYNTNQACTSESNSDGTITYSGCGFSQDYVVPVYANGWISESISSSTNTVYKGAGVNITFKLNEISSSVPQNISVWPLNASGAIESTIQIKYPGGSGACALTGSNPNCTVLITTKWSQTPLGLYTIKFSNPTLSGVPLIESSIIMQVVGPATYLQQTGENNKLSSLYCSNMVQPYESFVDCNLQVGVSLPPYGQLPNSRFLTDSATPGVVYDKLLQVVWTASPIAGGHLSWVGALNAVGYMNNGSGTYGYNNWRLPTVNELKSLVNYGGLLINGSSNTSTLLNNSGFTGVESNYYWTSSLYSGGVTDKYLPVWVVQLGSEVMSGDSLLLGDTNNNFGLVIPTDTLAGPGSQDGSLSYGALAVANVTPPIPSSSIVPALAPQTGENSAAPVCANNYNKNYMPAGSECNSTSVVGVAWPNPRFTSTGLAESCLLDNLTGLMWLKDSKQFGSPNWYDTLQSIYAKNESGGFCGYTDWRLPNINELDSLVNYGESSNFNWLTKQGFVMNLPIPSPFPPSLPIPSLPLQSYYWTSSFGDFYGGYVWQINMTDDSIHGVTNLSTGNANILVVRGGADIPNN